MLWFYLGDRRTIADKHLDILAGIDYEVNITAGRSHLRALRLDGDGRTKQPEGDH